MMELIMSRVWLVIAGIMVTGAVLFSFGALDDHSRDAVEMEGAESLARSIENLSSDVSEGKLEFEAKELLPPNGDPLRVYNGSIWVGEGTSAQAVDIRSSLVLISDRERVDHLIIYGDDLLILRSSGALDEREVQLEKVSATNLTVSMNFLHSSSVLYM
jgi:hypothetical protein